VEISEELAAAVAAAGGGGDPNRHLCVSDSEVDGRESPKKSVHFSEIDQVCGCGRK